MAAQELSLDREFRSLCPDLSDEEHHLLRSSIAAEGCRDPLIVWETGNKAILLDGHNRYQLCTELGKPFRTTAMAFASRDEARTWVIDNALARRNLSEDQKGYLRGKRYREQKKEHGGKRDSSGNSCHLKTAEKLASDYGVSEKTIRNDAQFSQAVDAIGKTAGAQIKRDILSGRTKLGRKDVIKFATLPPEKQKKALSNGYESVKKAIADPPPQRPELESIKRFLPDTACFLTRIVNEFGGWGRLANKETWGDTDRLMIRQTLGALSNDFSKCAKELENGKTD